MCVQTDTGTNLKDVLAVKIKPERGQMFQPGAINTLRIRSQENIER